MGPQAGVPDQTSSGRESDVTVGVSIAIPQPHASVLTNWRRRVGDPAADLVFPHVTLLPPTPVAPDAMAAVEDHLAAAAAESAPFDMHLAGTGTFRPTSAVVFIQIALGVAHCELLESRVRGGPLRRELEFPYHPHVTVAQEIDDAGLDEAYDGMAGFVARFPVHSFVLFCRSAGGQWQWHTEYALGRARPVSGGSG